MVRAAAGSYGIRENQVAFAGFSNGGLTGEACIRYYSGTQKTTDHFPDYREDDLDRYYGAPDAFLCIYGPRYKGAEFDYTDVEMCIRDRSEEGSEAAYREYQSALRAFNQRLAVLRQCLGMQSALSSYAARHTWATMAYHCEIHPGIISEAMGHSSITVTEECPMASDMIPGCISQW